MKIRIAQKDDYGLVMRIWESSVKATHHFLKEEDFLYYKALIPAEYLPQLTVHLLFDADNIPQGFAAVSDGNLEMLFIDAAARRRGYGKHLLQFALTDLGVSKVDVNEQNEQAVGFYKKMGFTVAGRSPKDAMDKDYPILHLVYRQS